MVRRLASGQHRSHATGTPGRVPALLLAAAIASFATFAAIAAGKAPRPGSPKTTVIYVGGEPRGAAMARIDARAPGTRAHALRVLDADVRDPDPPPKSPRIRFRHCHLNGYAFGKDADVVELRPGLYWLTVEAERLFPLPSAYTPASVFDVHVKIAVRGGRCYGLAMACEGEATSSDTCRVTLKPKRCAPLPSPRRVVLENVYAC